MTENKHTPGPWTYERDFDDFLVRDTDRNIILQADAELTSEADVALIAAAPALLEACEGLLRVLYSHDGHDADMVRIKQARLAIDQAKGAAPSPTDA